MGLFDWLKGKPETTDSTKTEINVEEKKQEIENLNEVLANTEDTEMIKEHLNQLGKIHFEIENISEAIDSWEKSLEYYDKPGYPHGKLMEAYTKKQTEAWKHGDDQASEKYAEKIDALMKKNKDSIRYN